MESMVENEFHSEFYKEASTVAHLYPFKGLQTVATPSSFLQINDHQQEMSDSQFDKKIATSNPSGTKRTWTSINLNAFNQDPNAFATLADIDNPRKRGNSGGDSGNKIQSQGLTLTPSSMQYQNGENEYYEARTHADATGKIQRNHMQEADGILDFFSPTLPPDQHEGFDDDEDDALTPLVSPAIAPIKTAEQPPPIEEDFSLMPASFENLPPQTLTSTFRLPSAKTKDSPKMGPKRSSSKSKFSTEMAVSDIQGLLSSPIIPATVSTQLGKIPIHMSPHLSPQLSPIIAPMLTPSALMQMTSKEERIRSSPNLKPMIKGEKEKLLSEEQVEQLAKKSNYQNLLEGSVDVLGHSKNSDTVLGVGQRKLTHKTAEQRRRDCLKAGYEELRDVLLGCDKAISKAEILKKAHEQIKNLRQRVRELEDENSKLKK